MSLLANAAREVAGSASPAALAAAAAVAEGAAAPAVTPAAAAPAPAAPAPAAQQPVDLNAVRNEARTAERDRIKAIVTHPEAEGRAAMAQHLAFSTDLAADTAGGLLATAPKAEAAPVRTLTGATVPQPNIAPQGGGSEPGDAKASLSAAVQAEIKASRRG
ncbi:MAG: hypothetical protein GY873_30155 [Bosea sp.]|uniref:hypothetical protein n=1 Tax=Bosea sp. (in: a-proteobacteria) TaxID=1871050 RepID=UPI0023A59C98|nr:hypothetical protein [Bosea sp. (in: a-proteobacteria)]MCP4738459.1 hypothetical protein [Bosea sp. (in: a-proteobacteria)]